MTDADQNTIDAQVPKLARFAWALLISLPIPAFAAEQIWIEPNPRAANQSDWYPKPIESIVADVVRFNATDLIVVRAGDDTESSIPAERVIWIEPQQRKAAEQKMVALFNDGQYGECLESLPEVLETRPPIWRQQAITMMAAVAASRCDRHAVALELVAQLDRRSLPPMVSARLPIQWANRRSAANAVTAANERLNDSSPLVRLVAVSWLLSSPRRSQAINELTTLQRSERADVQAMVGVLRWRTATPPQVSQSASRWQKTIDQLPMVWQTGPTTTLIDKLESAGLSDLAKPLRWSQQLTPIQPFPLADRNSVDQ